MKARLNVTFGVGPFIELPRYSGPPFTLNAALIVALSDYHPGTGYVTEGTTILMATGEQYIAAMSRKTLVQTLERAPHIRLIDFMRTDGTMVYFDPNEVCRVHASTYREDTDAKDYEGPMTMIMWGLRDSGGIGYKVRGTPEEIYAKLNAF
jgi:hypothetical protein